METLTNFLNLVLFSYNEVSFTVRSVLIIVIVLVAVRLFLWFIKRLLFRKNAEGLDKTGRFYSVYRIGSYIFWIVAILVVLDSFGVKLTVLLAGSAALLVGIGLGLQNTFNDFVSGFILLFEGSIKVGDILEVDGDLIKIRKIGFRVSEAFTRNNVVVIIPNSIITNNKVINWSHQSIKTRFRIAVGVAYGSDVNLVERLLIQSAKEHPEVANEGMIESRFVDFGSSSLDFELLFFSKNIFRIEKVKSDIRRTINQKFIENKITIPFPQIDLHVRSDDTK